ncbi:MAG: MGMT family protein, partial [Candidatus Rokuibacteriota bacterium]
PGESRSSYDRIYATVRRIPRGRVATYGQVASVAGLPGHARQVGYALHALPSGSSVPWHRVINAQGRVSARSRTGWEMEQRLRLEIEGVRFGDGGRVLLRRYLWEPRADGRGKGGVGRAGRGTRDARRREKAAEEDDE